MIGLCIGGPLDGKLSPDIMYGRSFDAHNPLPLDTSPISAVLPDALVVWNAKTRYQLVRFYSVVNGTQTVRFYWVPDEHCPDEQSGRDYVLDQMTNRYGETFEQALIRFEDKD